MPDPARIPVTGTTPATQPQLPAVTIKSVKELTPAEVEQLKPATAPAILPPSVNGAARTPPAALPPKPTPTVSPAGGLPGDMAMLKDVAIQLAESQAVRISTPIRLKMANLGGTGVDLLTGFDPSKSTGPEGVFRVSWSDEIKRENFRAKASVDSTVTASLTDRYDFKNYTFVTKAEGSIKLFDIFTATGAIPNITRPGIFDAKLTAGPAGVKLTEDLYKHKTSVEPSVNGSIMGVSFEAGAKIDFEGSKRGVGGFVQVKK